MLGDGEPPLGEDVDENHHDGKPPDVDLLLLLSIRERYIFFFSALTRRRQGCKEDDARANLGGFFFCPTLREYGGL